MKNDILKVLVSEEEIKAMCKRLGEEISRDYEGKTPLVVGLLKGCVPFMAELTKYITIKIEMDFMVASSYHGTINTIGDVKIKKDLDSSVSGRDVIIVEDIVDTGNTLSTICELLKIRGAKSIEVATLLDKPEGRVIDFNPKYVGTLVPKEFVVGFGLDYNEYYRNLPYIGVLKPEIYERGDVDE